MVFTENFIENYCENTDQPELECDGKCFLSDMLDKKDKDAPKTLLFFWKPSWFSQPLFMI